MKIQFVRNALLYQGLVLLLGLVLSGCRFPAAYPPTVIATTPPPPHTLSADQFVVTPTSSWTPTVVATDTPSAVPTSPPTITQTLTATPEPEISPTRLVPTTTSERAETATAPVSTTTPIARQYTVYEQRDWSVPGSYASASAIDPLKVGTLRLGFTLPANPPYEDLSQDGYPDIVYVNYYDNSSYEINSYIYWGSADGFSTGRRTELPTVGARGAAVSDLNNDGILDIVFANLHDDAGNYQVNNYVYWGEQGGYSIDQRTELPGSGSGLVSVADLDANGWQDIIFSNHYANEHTHEMDSYIYWGSPSGFSPANQTSLPTLGAYVNTPADVNLDGWLDLVFSNHRLNNDQSYEISSYIYWGGQEGFSTQRRAEILTRGATDNAVVDLNQDGYTDLLFSNFRSNQGRNTESWIYWGSAGGFDLGNLTALPTLGAIANSVADLNKDGYLDIVFSQFRDEAGNYDVGSTIFWGSAAGYNPTNQTTLETNGAVGNSVADLNRDGWLDLVFSNFLSSGRFRQDSYIYWGGPGGFGSDRRTSLPTLGAYDNSAVGGRLSYGHKGLGNSYSQATSEWTVPRIYPDSGHLVSVAFGGITHEWITATWDCALPTGTDVSLDVATSADGKSWSAWELVATSSVDGTNEAKLSVGTARFIRYRVTLHSASNHRLTPTISRVALIGADRVTARLYLPLMTRGHPPL